MKIDKEEIRKEIEEIKENKYLILVEGKKDKKALQSFGLKNIQSLENRPLFEVIESIKEKDLVLLTDLDTEGRKIYSKLHQGLQRRGIKINNTLRNKLFKTPVRQIEGLDTYLQEL